MARGKKGEGQGPKRGIGIQTMMREDRDLKGMIQGHKREIAKGLGIKGEEGIHDPPHQKEIIAIESTNTQGTIEDLAPQGESIEGIEDHLPVKGTTDRDIITEGKMKTIREAKKEMTSDQNQERILWDLTWLCTPRESGKWSKRRSSKEETIPSLTESKR